jgi:hypothetical protein
MGEMGENLLLLLPHFPHLLVLFYTQFSKGYLRGQLENIAQVLCSPFLYIRILLFKKNR